MVDGTPAVLSQHLGRPVVRVFSGKESITGCWLVFSRACHAAEEEEVGAGRTHRGWWHLLRS